MIKPNIVIRLYEEWRKFYKEDTPFIIVLNDNRKLEVLPLLYLESNNAGFVYSKSEQNYFILKVFFKNMDVQDILAMASNLSEKERFFMTRGYLHIGMDFIQDGDMRKSSDLFFMSV